MKYPLNLKPFHSLAVICFFAALLPAQSRPTSEADYNGTFTYAVSETNSAYPVIFEVDVEEFLKGKLVWKSTEYVENEAQGRHRSTKTIVEGRITKVVNEVLVGFGNGFCKEGNGKWRKSQYVCLGPSRLFRQRIPESVEFSVEDKTLNGKKVKIYRKYSIFSGSSGKDFEEEVATIDSDGYFINVIDTHGTLNPRVITRIQKQIWIIRAKIMPIEAPIK